MRRVKSQRPKRNTGRGGYNGCPIVLAIRVGDFKALVNGKAEIVASIETPSAVHINNGRKRAQG